MLFSRLGLLTHLRSPSPDITSEAKEILRNKLETIIVTTLRRHPSLQYFQGYHDVSNAGVSSVLRSALTPPHHSQIISVLLLTLEDEELSLAAAKRMSLHRLRDSMGSGLEPVLGYLR